MKVIKIERALDNTALPQALRHIRTGPAGLNATSQFPIPPNLPIASAILGSVAGDEFGVLPYMRRFCEQRDDTHG